MQKIFYLEIPYYIILVREKEREREWKGDILSGK